jgi:hypothetical protein
MPLNPQLWGYRKLVTKQWPIQGANGSAAPQQITFDVKDFLQTGVLSKLLLRVRGNVIVAGAGAGAATGKDNPESLVVAVNCQTNPSVGMISRNNLSARGLIQQGIFDRGYAIHGANLPDTAATVPIDFSLPLVYKQPGSANPIEWALPVQLFTSIVFTVLVGSREELFTGGTNTFDVSGLVLEVWADVDQGVAGAFHAVENFETVIPVLQTQTDLTVRLDPGFLYSHLLFVAEDNGAKSDTIINSISVQGGGRIWTPQGDNNYKMIQRLNRETHIYNAAEDLTGTAFVAGLRDGMYTRAIDALTDQVQIKLDVNFTAAHTMNVRIIGKRIKPLALKLSKAA